MNNFKNAEGFLRKGEDYFRNNLLLVIHGVDEPGEEITRHLPESLQKRLDLCLLDQLINIFCKNRKIHLTQADIQVGLIVVTQSFSLKLTMRFLFGMRRAVNLLGSYMVQSKKKPAEGDNMSDQRSTRVKTNQFYRNGK